MLHRRCFPVSFTRFFWAVTLYKCERLLLKNKCHIQLYSTITPQQTFTFLCLQGFVTPCNIFSLMPKITSIACTKIISLAATKLKIMKIVFLPNTFKEDCFIKKNDQWNYVSFVWSLELWIVYDYWILELKASRIVSKLLFLLRDFLKFFP